MSPVQLLFVVFAILSFNGTFACERSTKIFNAEEISRSIDTSSITIDLASRSRIAKKDLDKLNPKSLLGYHLQRLSSLEDNIIRAGPDIFRIVDIINTEFGGRVVILANETLSIDIDVIGKLIEESSGTLLERQLKENLFVELYLRRFTQELLGKILPTVKSLIDGKSLSVSDLQVRLLQNQNPKFRACSMNVIQIIFQLIRLQLGTVLVPIQKTVITAFTQLTDYILTFYVSTASTNPIITSIAECTNALIMQVSSITVSVQETVNVVFNYAIYGTSTGIDSDSDSDSDSDDD